MNARLAISIGMLAAVAAFAGCASHPRIMSGPNAGIIVTSSQMSGGPYTNGEIKVIANKAAYATQWCPYQGSPPSNPIWLPTTNSPGNPSQYAPGAWMVMLRANQAVNFQSNPVAITVVGDQRTRIAVTYP